MDNQTEAKRLATAYVAAIDEHKPGWTEEACRLYAQLVHLVGWKEAPIAINEAARAADKAGAK